MSFASRHLRLIGPLAAAAALSASSMPAFAQTVTTTTPSTTGACTGVRFELANPAPGTEVNGDLVVQGIAQDMRATPAQGLGIDRVDFFLGSRDTGGTSIGTALPGAVGGPFGPNSFQTTISFPKSQKGGHDFVAYAHSVVTGQESVLSMPIAVGESPQDANVDTAAAVTAMCIGKASTANAGATTPAVPGAPATTVPAAPAAPAAPASPAATTGASTISISVGNPSSGDTIKTGAISISGDAKDTAATSGSGIDRIDIFLDDRDTGGLFLGSAQLGPGSFWQATVTLPNNQQGLHTLFFYAHATSGKTATAKVPVTTER